jgi:hypothetical protein
MRWLSSRLAYDSPRGRRVRVGGGSKLEVSVLGGMVRRRSKDLVPSAVQTQEPKTKVLPRFKAMVGLM